MDSLYEYSGQRASNLHDEEQSLQGLNRASAISLLFFISILGFSRSGPYMIALRLYPRAGGGGLNVLHKEPEGTHRRVAALDLHPVLDRKTRQQTWTLHAHHWPNLKKHHTIFNSGIVARKKAMMPNDGGMVLEDISVLSSVGDGQNPADMEEYMLQRVLRPCPF